MLQSFKKLSKVTQFLSYLAGASAACIVFSLFAVFYGIPHSIFESTENTMFKIFGLISIDVFLGSLGWAIYLGLQETVGPYWGDIKKSEFNQSLYRWAGVCFTLGIVFSIISSAFIFNEQSTSSHFQIMSLVSYAVTAILAVWANCMFIRNIKISEKLI